MDLSTLKSAIRGDAKTNQQSPMATQGNVKPRIGKHKKKPSMELKMFSYIYFACYCNIKMFCLINVHVIPVLCFLNLLICFLCFVFSCFKMFSFYYFGVLFLVVCGCNMSICQIIRFEKLGIVLPTITCNRHMQCSL